MDGGNETIVDVPVTIDYRPPSLSLAPGITYAKRAGSVALVYDVSDDTERDGVEVGDRFYRSVPVRGEGVPAGRRFALFPLAQELPSDVKISVVAIDHAGNRSARTPQINIKDRVYPDETIVLSQRFLEQKIADLAGATGVNDSDKLKAFQEINTRIRRENEEKIRERQRRVGTRAALHGGVRADARFAGPRARSPSVARTCWKARRSPSRSTTATTSRRSPGRRFPRRTADAWSSPTNSASTATA